MRYVADAEEHLTDLGVANGTRLAPEKTVLIVVRSMALAKRLQISLTRREVAFNQDIKAILPTQDVDPRYLFFALWGCHNELHALVDEASHGTKRLRTDVLGDFRVPIPPPAEQHRIVAVLAALDDRIDSNRRLAGICEEVARAAFTARFVTFTGRTDLVETELGSMPHGWSVAPIGDVLKVVGGSTPSTREPRYWDGGTNCWATPKDLAGLPIPVLLDTARHITDDGVSRISSRLLPERTVLLSSRAPVGYTAISMVEVAVNQGFIAIPPSGAMPSEFVLFWLRENMDRIHAHAGGTTFAEISKRAFRPLLMQVPPPEELSDFEQVARPLFDLTAAMEREIRTLAETRNVLLPKLISGEVRVPATADAEDLIEPPAEAWVA